VRANSARSRVMDTRTTERMGHLLSVMIADPKAQEKRRVSAPGRSPRGESNA
jgi:hypothetical protein